jgi:cytochrome c peroxidase
VSGIARTLRAVVLLAPLATAAVDAAETRTADQVSVAILGLPAPANREAPPPGVPALGRKLFFDARLSADGKVSCATCHQPDSAFSDGRPVSVGVAGSRGTRNTPSVLNAAFHASQFWEGRRGSLEEQVLDPLVNPVEHGLPGREALLELLRNDPDYPEEFQRVFGPDSAGITPGNVAAALAAFVRSLPVGDSPADRYLYGGERAALSEAERRGLELFRGRAQCAGCHVVGERHATFSDDGFHSVGTGLHRIAPKLGSLATRVATMAQEEAQALISRDPEIAALGRFLVTRDPADIGKFRTPSLRNVALTAPYMHDGSVATLEDAVEGELYYRGHLQGRPLVLTPAEKADLVLFLRSLTSSSLAVSR